MILPAPPYVVLVNEVMLTWTWFEKICPSSDIKNYEVRRLVINSSGFSCSQSFGQCNMKVAVAPVHNSSKTVKAPDSNNRPEVWIQSYVL